jgi:acyl carrier protein
MKQDTFQLLARLIAQKLARKVTDITPATDLIADLKLDSLQLIELFTELEEHFHISLHYILSDKKAMQIRTMGDVVSYIDEHGQKPATTMNDSH